MKTVTIKLKCSCGFEVVREVEVNKFGYFEIPDAYCPNDLFVLIQNIDHREKDE